MTSGELYARKALLASFAGYAADGFDMLIFAFILPAITATLNLTPAESGSFVTWTLFGTLIGGLAFGYLSDRFGRVRVLKWSVLLFAVFTGFCAIAQGYWTLVILRVIGGLGLGGEFGIGMTLVAETWPAAVRGRISSTVALGWQAGVLCAALLIPPILPFIGWRGVFVIGSAPAVLAFLIRRLSIEPEIFLTRVSVARTSPWRALVKDGKTIRLSLAIFVMCSIQNFGYYGLMIWLPSIVSKRLNLGLTKSSIWTIATIAGMGCGIWVFGQIADRFGRRAAFLGFQLGATAAVLIFSQVRGPTTLLFAGFGLGIFVNGMLGGYGALISEIYPTEARSTAQNTLFNLGRTIGGFGPVVIGIVATHFTFSFAIAMLSGLYIVDLLVTAFIIPETKGRQLV